jgi:hypothetical protein
LSIFPRCHEVLIYAALIVYDFFKTSQHYIVTASIYGITKIRDLKGNTIREDNSGRDTYYMYPWYDRRNNGIYLFHASDVNVTMFDFYTGNMVKCFTTGKQAHLYPIVKDYNNRPHLFEARHDGLISIWDIDYCSISKSIMVPNSRGLVIWNDKYAITNSASHFNIIDYRTGVYSSINGEGHALWKIEKAVHPRYGECLLTLGQNGKICLWTI